MNMNQLKMLLKGLRIKFFERDPLGMAERLKTSSRIFIMLVTGFSTGNRKRLSRNRLRVIWGYVLFCACAVQAAENPHTVSATEKSGVCTSCHAAEIHYDKADLLNTKNNHVDLTAFNMDGVEMCSGCHNAEEGHKVGLKLDFEIPADMPLNKRNTLSCLTCHYTHGSLESVRPQASFSFMDRMVNAERLHKSFLLRRNNVDGELCLICHNSNQGSK